MIRLLTAALLAALGGTPALSQTAPAAKGLTLGRLNPARSPRVAAGH